jgi:hypothetical protein
MIDGHKRGPLTECCIDGLLEAVDTAGRIDGRTGRRMHVDGRVGRGGASRMATL